MTFLWVVTFYLVCEARFVFFYISQLTNKIIHKAQITFLDVFDPNFIRLLFRYIYTTLRNII